MIAIIGLGNPGQKYQDTRHNVGFRVIEELAKTNQLTAVNQDRLSFEIDRDLKAKIVQSHFKKTKVLLAKPQTFVNSSGQAVKKIKNKFKIDFKNIWIVCDDLSLPISMIRARQAGSSGGHNGLEDIINKLESRDFPRLRIGIKPIKGFRKESPEIKEDLEAKEFVLSRFSNREEKILKKVLLKAKKYLLASLAKKRLTSTTIG